MTDRDPAGARRVRAALARGDLLHPCEGPASTVDLSAALATLAGVPDLRLTEPARSLARSIGSHDHYVLVLVDGLGMNLVEPLPADALFRAHLAGELRAVFPSSTASAITSLATAAWPAEHAVVGWWTYLPDAAITATMLPYIERFSEKPLDIAQVPPRYAFPLPSIASRLTRRYVSFAPGAIPRSVYSRYSSGDAPSRGYDTLARGVASLVEHVRTAASPTYSYLYVPHVDTTEHTHGPQAPETSAALAEVQSQLTCLVHELDGRARTVITADHGQFSIGRTHWMRPGDALDELLLVPPTGDGRTHFFHVKNALRNEFEARFTESYGDTIALVTLEEAEDLALFGPVPLAPETRRRLGDFIGVALDRDVLFHQRSAPREQLRGHHGGLTPDEMRIPLILA